MTNIDLKHDFEPTDSQGYEMECIRCGRFVSVCNDD